MEDHLGRDLLLTEYVHHRNGDRLDNHLSNLELWTTNQPKGQRVEDLLEWAKELLVLYAEQEAVVEEGVTHEIIDQVCALEPQP